MPQTTHTSARKPTTRWSYPFALRDKNAPDTMDSHFAVLSRMTYGTFPLASNGFAQGSIHFGPATGEGFDLDAGFRALADGEVIAYRLDSALRTLDYDHDKGERVISYSTGFVLVRHWMALPPKAPAAGGDAQAAAPAESPSANSGHADAAPDGIYIYSLYYYNRPFNEFKVDAGNFPKAHLPFWKGHRLFRVRESSKDTQADPQGLCVPETPQSRFRDPFAPLVPAPPKPMVGLNIRAAGKKDAEIIGILHRGSVVSVEGDATHGWARLKKVHFGNISAPAVGAWPGVEARVGWVYLGEMDTAISPDAAHVDEVVVLDKPYPVKAGDLLGYMGNSPGTALAAEQGRGKRAPVMALEVFAGDDFPAFLAESRARAEAAPPEERTVLVIEAGAKLPYAHAAPTFWRPDTDYGFKALPGERGRSLYRRGHLYKRVSRPASDTLTKDETKRLTGYRQLSELQSVLGKPSRVSDAEYKALPPDQKAEYGLVELAVQDGDKVVWGEVWTNRPKIRPTLLWNTFPLRLDNPGIRNVVCPSETSITRAQLNGLPEDARAIDENGVHWWFVPLPTDPPCSGWVRETDHPGTRWTTPAAWAGFNLVDATTFTLLEAFQRAAVVQGFVKPRHEEEFAPVASALGHSDMVVKLQEAIDNAGDRNGRVSAKEIRAARAIPALAQRLSRLIVKFESHWSDNVQRWTTLNDLMNQDWKREMERQLNRNWWSKVASKIPSFPQDPHIWHMHPFGWVDNFMKCREGRDRFERLTDIVIRHEGGFANVAGDKGGKTTFGISTMTWNAVAQSHFGLDPHANPVANITQEQARLIYRNTYWRDKGHDEVRSERLALMLYDWSITSGLSGREVRRYISRKSVNIDQRNGFRPDIAKALNDFNNDAKVLEEVADLRRDYYKQLVVDDSTQAKFLTGWLNRVNDCMSTEIT